MEREMAMKLLPQASDSGPNPFSLATQSKREALHMRLVEKQDTGRRKGGKAEKLQSLGITPARTPMSKNAASSTLRKRTAMTPAARSLAKQISTPRAGKDVFQFQGAKRVTTTRATPGLAGDGRGSNATNLSFFGSLLMPAKMGVARSVRTTGASMESDTVPNPEIRGLRLADQQRDTLAKEECRALALHSRHANISPHEMQCARCTMELAWSTSPFPEAMTLGVYCEKACDIDGTWMAQHATVHSRSGLEMDLSHCSRGTGHVQSTPRLTSAVHNLISLRQKSISWVAANWIW
ncbi:hypothetical protein MRB53_040757 [Persea americana]|nr:hypothetical protein MRB53_040757 [Persea americana]